uniref:PPM-type phosphatase domain-containing protein n=1 Tax=Grammatophora oceanica TaxID=210454 RepID=A0A7S1VKM7_9STRA|mmetsp:Transcript_4789/g.6682  ORF Transcript_4789/g.6682 Transcript_4789/m.6682 type:complete len:689 (+) Transcript_4789:85-2151(+)|eukprot:CAMPEP_0194049754 /NCGR_PEP_ID=MMETSP0009_2-20130614/30874_1 /TAXON_ID=210454 /ORGANISM="Grammatophora oceanica, Strain CCMP 410" /LENGTH=688 /DNA_ID=CAMNT_0038695975 /DNA_START=54 /DNA_END=2120 /DNA_ORIENTATION=-
MLARWFERGIGQIVAPDETIASREPPEEAASDFWATVAPDPVWEASQHGTRSTSVNATTTPAKHPPASAFLSPPARGGTTPTGGSSVVCVHCNQLTPTKTGEDDLIAFDGLFSPVNAQLSKKVLTAAQYTAVTMTSPPKEQERFNKVFRLVSSSKTLDPKMLGRLEKLLRKDLDGLLNARSAHLGNLCPDGLTPLMAAAYHNQVGSVKLILELAAAADSPDGSPTAATSTATAAQLTTDVDLQGRTAEHIAAEMGAVDVLPLLKGPQGQDAPVDLVGRTPLGRAVSSSHKAAQVNRSELQKTLFSPGDKSICGEPTPAKARLGKSSSNIGSGITVAYGMAEMPGFRIQMEDATCCHSWPGHTLLGVCDGHGDQGRVSAYVAEHMPKILREQLGLVEEGDTATALEKACLFLDNRLKSSGIKGGSTAVWALITDKSIIVANVGDSRCILVQQEEEEDEPELVPETPKVEEEGPVEETKEEPKDAEDDKKPEDGETPKAANSAPTTKRTTTVVQALSFDHKPDRTEEKARVEKAGLSVVEESFVEEGIKHVIPKVQLTENGDRLAVSRAFGDFEYKTNPSLSSQEQAVICMPEIEIHRRNAKKDIYLVLACDGVWDVMENDQVGKFVVDHVEDLVKQEATDILPQVGDALLTECLNRGSQDNMTAIVVALSDAAELVANSGVLHGKALSF